jgi:putative endonuclease
VKRVQYYVYMLASRRNGTLYVGVTRDLVGRAYQHRTKATPGFTSRYGVQRLVWFEVYDDPTNAISREKEIKKWRRAWKLRLIEESNPQCRDLYDDIAV